MGSIRWAPECCSVRIALPQGLLRSPYSEAPADFVSWRDRKAGSRRSIVRVIVVSVCSNGEKFLRRQDGIALLVLRWLQ